MEKKFYESPMSETIELKLKSSLLSGSDVLEDPSMGGSEAGYSDPDTFKP